MYNYYKNCITQTLSKQCNGPDEDADVVHSCSLVLCDDEECVCSALSHEVLNSQHYKHSQSTEACADNAKKWAGFTTACADNTLIYTRVTQS